MVEGSDARGGSVGTMSFDNIMHAFNVACRDAEPRRVAIDMDMYNQRHAGTLPRQASSF